MIQVPRYADFLAIQSLSADFTKVLGETSLRSSSQVRDFCLHLVCQRDLVELSGLDSNKCKAVLAFKQRIAEHPEWLIKLSSQEKQSATNREIDKFGEIATKRLQQAFRIPFTDEDIGAIISAYNSGTSTYKIAKQYGCCKNTISVNSPKNSEHD